MATAYQSCEVTEVDPLTEETPKVGGIKIVGTHPSGGGYIREISDLNLLLTTHPYLSDYKQPLSTCFPVLQHPGIYDYGGKPYAESGRIDTLNLFRNAGTGSKELGIDCSGFVYTALASAGLKLKKTGRLKAIGVYGVSASMMKNPQNNGLTCLNEVIFTPTQSLRPGDILASSGHVFLIDSTGPDPLGIGQITKIENCDDQHISPFDFDFTLIQSDPSKGGIGLNRMKAVDYLMTSLTMAEAMMEHAVKACQAKLLHQNVKSKSTLASLVRHSGTEDCTDNELELTQVSCITSCPKPNPQNSLNLFTTIR